MERTRWFAIVAMVVTTMGFVACDSGNSSGTDTLVTDTAQDVPPADVVDDKGVEDLGVDHGPADPGKETVAPDTAPVDNTPTDTAPTCPAMISGPTCNAIAACALQCTEAGREAACVGTADAAEKAKWETLRDCLATAACPKVFENEQFSTCAVAACGAALDGCFTTAGGKCCTIVNCRKDCDPDDPACPMRCYGKAPKEEQVIFVDYKDCILGVECAQTDVRANGWPTWTCEEYAQYHNCPNQQQACFPPNCI